MKLAYSFAYLMGERAPVGTYYRAGGGMRSWARTTAGARIRGACAHWHARPRTRMPARDTDDTTAACTDDTFLGS